MKNRFGRRLSLGALLLSAIFFCSGCGPADKGFTRTPEEIAEDFVGIWKAKWNTIEGSQDFLLDDGKAFLADLDGDLLPELFFVYDNYKTSGVVAYRISGDTTEELICFDSSLITNELTFELYQGRKKNIIHTESIFYGPAADPSDWITGVYVTCSDNGISVDRACRLEPAYGGETVYYESPEDGTEITKAEYEDRIAGILKDTQLSETVVLPKDDVVEGFLDGDSLEQYILSLINQYAE